MKLTNNLNLPQALYDAVKNDGYSSGDADFSVTTLLKPPRAVALQKKHWDEIEEDASDRIWSLLGQVVHGILERANRNGESERRLNATFGGIKVSGGMDLYNDGLLQDYKFVTVYKFQNNKVPVEYEEQLNCYAEILRENGFPVHKLQIVGILRDWSKNAARKDPSMPQSQVVVRDVPLWTSEQAQEFIFKRIKLHIDAKTQLPLCTAEEKWEKPTRYAVMKAGKDRAIKLYDFKSDAEAHASIDKTLRVETRPGEAMRCSMYCNVSNFCSQFKSQGENL